MTDNTIHQTRGDRPRSSFERFGPFFALTFIGHAAGVAVPLGILGLAQNVPLGSLLRPYSCLAYCGIVLCPLAYWARLARQRPQSCARRFAIAVFFYLLVLAPAIEFALARLRITSTTEAIRDFGAFSVILPVFGAVIVYFTVRQMLKDLESENAPAPGSPG